MLPQMACCAPRTPSRYGEDVWLCCNESMKGPQVMEEMSPSHRWRGNHAPVYCTVGKKWNVWQQCKAYKLKERLKHHLIRSVDWLGARCRAVNNIWWLWSEKIKILSKYLKGGCPKGEQNQSKRWQWWNSKSEMNGREKKRKLMNKSHERPQNLKLTEREDMIKDWIPQLSRNDARFSQSQGFTKKPTLTQG